MSFNEKLNALVRFSVYLTIILYMYNFNYLNLYIVILVMGITYLIHYFKKTKPIQIDSLNNYDSANNLNKQIYNKYNKKTTCRKPTKDNPFMNWLVTDKNYKTACDTDDKNIKKQINKYFNTNLYQNVGDVYQNNNSQRQYYTTPVSSGMSDQGGFANWLYNTPRTCKEGNGNQCVANNSKMFLSDTDYQYRYK